MAGNPNNKKDKKDEKDKEDKKTKEHGNEVQEKVPLFSVNPQQPSDTEESDEEESTVPKKIGNKCGAKEVDGNVPKNSLGKAVTYFKLGIHFQKHVTSLYS